MNPLSSFAILIATARSLLAAVSTRDDLHIRPPFARKSVAARLASGLALLRAYLRRLIILIALDLEWHLVDTRGVMKRPHGRKSISSARPNLSCLDVYKASPWANACGPKFKARNAQGYSPSQPVDMGKLYAHLDYLAAIAGNPLAKAERLAFHLARTQQGVIMAPKGPRRVAGFWGTEVSASYDAMAASIITRSRNRPPPLPPPRTHWPSITAL
jgi:hypothetical protein